ncbi:unnamed protein product [Paramecium octaurelia]|uniref:Uncharacterized protein n=1 Tax=Paramecium octaurelia TaxID=43137 RepID=A0A8S1TUY3_PAROT|nr:unnamed protein product [Paramecium octaurelia]
MEQLLERYEELKKRNIQKNQSMINQQLICSIQKISQAKIEKRITLVQDVINIIMKLGLLRKQREPLGSSYSNCQSLVKDIDMHINSIMFEIDKLEQLKQKSQRFLRLQSQPKIKPDKASTDVMAQTGGLLSSTSDGQTRMYHR